MSGSFGARGTVAVLGNGPVGQTTALLLARWGVRTVLLDGRQDRDLAGSRSICQQRDVLDIWESAGAGARIAAEGYYAFRPGQGLISVHSHKPPAVRGRSLLSLAAESLSDAAELADAQRVLQAALAACLEGRPLATRAVAKSIKRRAAP